MNRFDPAPLVLTSLSKTYPNKLKALDSVSLTVNPGEVFGLIGPNGAGKSTMLKLASGLLFPETGSVQCGNEDVTRSARKASRYISLMPDPLGVYTDISCREYLQFFARAYSLPHEPGTEPMEHVIEMLELGPWLSEEVETLSAGWQRRLALGRILLADAPILLLDEPAAGLDVAARDELLRLVRRLSSDKRAIIISSHILPELDQLADRFGILEKGRWIEMGPGKTFFSREELHLGLGAPCWKLRCNDAEKARRLLNAQQITVHGNDLHIAFSDETAAAGALRSLVNNSIDVYEFSRIHEGLSELVLNRLRKNT